MGAGTCAYEMALPPSLAEVGYVNINGSLPRYESGTPLLPGPAEPESLRQTRQTIL